MRLKVFVVSMMIMMCLIGGMFGAGVMLSKIETMYGFTAAFVSFLLVMSFGAAVVIASTVDNEKVTDKKECCAVPKKKSSGSCSEGY